jgi:putative ABC transport system substrate-binding protein
MRRIGVLMNFSEGDLQAQRRITVFREGLAQLGWREGYTLQIDIRWGADDAESSRRHMTELLGLAPDVMFATTTAKVDLLRQTTRTVPIVFAGVSDPVGAGLVASLARPGGNITGFALPEYGISVKWLELLKEIAPQVTRIGVLSSFGSTPGIGQLAALQAVAPSMRVDLRPLVVGDANEIEASVQAFAAAPKGGLIEAQYCKLIAG